jgi:hypothetical protein
LHYKKARKENNILHFLNKFTQVYNCHLTQYEFCGDFIIGIDDNKCYIFFYKHGIKDSLIQFAHLSEFQYCKAVNINRIIKTQHENVTQTEKVEILFSPVNKRKSETIFKLFDADVNNQLSGELQLVDKWCKLINERIKSLNK